MKSLSRIIFFSILLFLFISCKKNENKDFTAAAIDIENSQREELVTVEEVKERLDLVSFALGKKIHMGEIQKDSLNKVRNQIIETMGN